MRYALLFSLTAAFLAAPALAAGPDNPVTQKDVSARDVVSTPASDLNLKKDEIPSVLVTAELDPYSLRGMTSCRRLSAAIVDLDQALGDDVDMARAAGKRIQPGHAAREVVGSFIPFRGLIREISGANANDRRMLSAMASGLARRSFLKGTGQARGCAYPARSAN